MKSLKQTEETIFYIFSSGYVAGVDEAGRGPLAGPVVASAVIFPPFFDIDGVYDSKALSEDKRIIIYKEIKRYAIDVSIGKSTVKEIDSLNIHRATLLAMKRAIEGLKFKPEIIFIDGKFKVEGIDIPQFPVVKGDRRYFSIAAASIVAKVTRDNILKNLHKRYPVYGFLQNKGYPTILHRRALKKLGP